MELAFDEKAVLKNIPSSTLIPGHTKIILGASGSGKSTSPEDHHGVCCAPTKGFVWVNGERASDWLSERKTMAVRADPA